jgi:hypothetical protein
MKMKKLLICCIAILFFTGGCSLLFGGPKSTVKKFYKHLEAGEIDAVIALFSKTSKAAQFQGKVKPLLVQGTETIKQKKGISSIDIISEEITGETAKVKFTIKYNDGSSEQLESKLIKEDGDWKFID